MRKVSPFVVTVPGWRPVNKRQLIGIIVASLTFVLGNFSTRLHPKPTPRFRLVSPKQSEHFGKFHSREYEAWDGRRLHLYCHTTDSEQEGRDWFYEELSHASEILERGPFLNESGEQIGERAVVEFPPTRYRGRVSGIVVLKGVNVFVMFGESLGQVLEFERLPEILRHNITSS